MATAAAAAAAVKKRLVVFGGSGFLGTRICKAAATRGWEVTAVSRSGEPEWTTTGPPEWAKQVSWEKADILKPTTYDHMLDGADAVVHSMGILLEADYKGIISGKESPIRGLQRAFSSVKLGTQNPLTQSPGESAAPQEKDGQLTYEVMNRDSAIILAREASAKNVGSYVYISAAAGAPFLPGRYITTKRDAESTIASEFPRMRGIFARPSFLYDSSRTITIPIAAAGFMASMVNSAVGGRLTPLMGAGGVKPIPPDTVGEAVVEAIAEDDIRGVLEVTDLESLANKVWRRKML